MFELVLDNIVAISQLSISIVTAIIAFFVYKTTRTLGRLEQMRFITDQYQNINKLLIEDRDAYDAFISLSGSDVKYRQEKSYLYKTEQIIVMILQIGNSLYSGLKSGYVDEDLFDDYINNLINNWITKEKDLTLSILDHWGTEYGRYLSDKIRDSMN